MERKVFFAFRILLTSLLLLAYGIPGIFAGDKGICIVEVREYPGRDPKMWDGLYAARDGKVYSALITEGQSAHFYVYNPGEKRNILLGDMADFLGERGKGIRTSGKIHNKPVEDNAGNIYFCTMSNGSGPNNIDYTSWRGGHWIRYSPATGKMENLGLVEEGVGCYPLAIDPLGKYLYGIGFTGYFYRFDLEKRITKNFGRVSNWDICRDIFCDDRGNVYMSFPTARIACYDAHLEKVTGTSLFLPHDPSVFPAQLKNPMIDRTNIWRAVEWDPVEKVAYGITGGSGSILFRFDTHDGVEGKITAMGRMCDSRFLEGNQKNIPYSTLAFALDSRGRKVYVAPSARSFSVQTYAETYGSSEGHHLIMYDLQKNERIDLGAMQTADRRRIFGCEAASVAPDGTVYLCGEAEVKDEKKSTQKAGDIFTALHLIIYTP